MSKIKLLFIFGMVFVWTMTGCSTASTQTVETAALDITTPTSMLSPRAWRTAMPTFTAIVTATATPTETPFPTPTLSPWGEARVSPSFSVTYKRSEWEVQDDGHRLPYLVHQQIPGCAVNFGPASDVYSPPEIVKIGGLPYWRWQWLNEQGGLTIVFIGPKVPGNFSHIGARMDAPANRGMDCWRATVALLNTLHYRNPVCPEAQVSSLKAGMKVQTVDYVYIRSEPRWAKNTRLKQLRPGVKMEIVGGPVCALYNKGVYVYWHVRLPDGQEVWVAEGDPQGAYIEPVP